MDIKKISICLLTGLAVFFLSGNTALPADTAIEANPKGLAINPVTGVVVIANESSDSVLVIDIETQRVLSTIPVGKRPRGVGIDTDLNTAAVSNNSDNTVSIIDLEKYKVVGTVPVGKDPQGVAIDQPRHKGLIANHKDGTVSMIDLLSKSVLITIPVGQEPKGVAVDSGLSLALVVNEKDYSLSILDLSIYQEIGLVQVGKKPIAISINPETHMAVVADEKDNAITVMDLESWKTKDVLLGKHPVAVALNSLDNRSLAVCDEDRTAMLTDSDLNSVVRIYSLNKLPRGVAIDNFRNVAAITDDQTDTLTFIQLPNPIPEITTIAPASVLRGSSDIVLGIAGNKFIKSSHVLVALLSGSQALASAFVDNHSLKATLSADLFSKPGSFPIAVLNPDPDGGRSGSAYFTVNNPAPSITRIEPQDVIAGTSGLTLNIYGTGFFDDTGISIGGLVKPGRYIEDGILQIDLTAEDLNTAGNYEVITSNAQPGGGVSNKVIFTIRPAIEIKIISPSDGATINKAKTMIKGTYNSDSADIGITVNGILANSSGNEWVANDIPLSIGETTIRATIKDALGNTADSSIVINTSDTIQKVRLIPNLTSGISPLPIVFSVSTAIPNQVESYQIDFEGDGTVNYSGPNFDGITYTFTTEGAYYPTVTVVDDQGNTFTDTIAVSILNKAELDSLLVSKWEGMKSALKSKEIEAALGFFIESARENERTLFQGLEDQLPSIMNTFKEFTIKDVYENLAEYEITDNEGNKYHGVMIRFEGGLWKFRDF